MPKNASLDVKSVATLLAVSYAPQRERSELGWLIIRHAFTSHDTGGLYAWLSASSEQIHMFA